MKKVFLAILCLAFIVIPFSACGDRREDVIPPPGGGKVDATLSIAFFKGGYGDEWVRQIATDFSAMKKEKDDLNIAVSLEGDSQMIELIAPRLNSGTQLADIFFGDTKQWHQWASKGQLEPLDDLYATEIENGETLADKIDPNFAIYPKMNGTYYVVPWNDGVTSLVYNKKMFSDYGWQVPETVEQLKTLCAKIVSDAAPDIRPFTWAGQIGGGGGYWDFLTRGWWANYEGEENFKSFYKFENAEVYQQQGRLKALEAFEDLCVKNGSWAVSAIASKDHIKSQMDFVQGKAAMMPNGAWVEPEMKNSTPAGFEMAMMPLPKMTGTESGPNYNYTAAQDFAIIPKQAKNKALAKEFLIFMNTEAMLQKYHKITGSPRPFKYDYDAVTGLTGFQESVRDVYKNAVNVYSCSESPLHYKGYAIEWPGPKLPFTAMITDKKTALQAFQDDYSFVSSRWPGWKIELGIA